MTSDFNKDISRAAAILGKKGGKSRSKAKTAAARRNARMVDFRCKCGWGRFRTHKKENGIRLEIKCRKCGKIYKLPTAEPGATSPPICPMEPSPDTPPPVQPSTNEGNNETENGRVH